MFRVLIVDDEPRSAEMIRSMLIIHFPVIAVSGIALGVKEAIEKLQLQPVDLVFLDIELNGQSGFELLDKRKTGSGNSSHFLRQEIMLIRRLNMGIRLLAKTCKSETCSLPVECVR
jgi:CheY-like chemotaxis protein